MSRSRRKTPIMGVAGGPRASEKKDKTMSAKLVRAAAKQLIAKGSDILPERPRDMFNPWGMSKDGKATFDPKKWPKWMRK